MNRISNTDLYKVSGGSFKIISIVQKIYRIIKIKLLMNKVFID